jgi:hypothetical protein
MIGEVQSKHGRTYNNPPDWIPTSREFDESRKKALGDDYQSTTIYDDFYVLFIDEWRRGNQLTHNAMMELTLSRKIFGAKLHEKTFVVVADNENLDIYNGDANVDPAQLDRVCQQEYAPTDEELLAIYRRKTDAGEMHPAVLEFLMTYKEYIMTPSDTIRDCAVQHKKTASPRGWEKLGRALMNSARRGKDRVELSEGDVAENAKLANIARGYVGIHGDPFVTFCNDRKVMSIDLEKVIYCAATPAAIAERDAELAKLNDIKMLSIPVIAYQASKTVTKKGLPLPQHGANLLKLVEALPNEGVAAFFHDWRNADEAAATNWMSYSGARMNAVYKTLGGYKKWCESAIRNGIDITSDAPIGK